MTKTTGVSYWDDRAMLDKNFSSVIAPDDKLGLKAAYAGIINKRIIEQEVLKLKAGSSILDFGCGVGRLSQLEVFKSHHYTGVDISEKMIQAAKSRFSGDGAVQFALFDGSRLPLDDNSVDCILSIWVLQHILDEAKLRALIEEFYRVLKDEALLLIIEQLSDTGYDEILESELVYKKHRTLKDYSALFSKGFLIERSKKTDGLISHGLFYKSLNVFRMLNFSFVKQAVSVFVWFDDLYYVFISTTGLLKPKWIDTFILLRKGGP